ncbi:3-isopropylmalate dehydrogenase [Listeria ivanovii]|uniref:3-isopropylmalate dehydrogenase n=1 Tax=Listeria ivanovii TaxID=1638 RepID=A0AAX2DNS0_LISIV|nr:3-isopropylmalate dehydrogenase [Listeria ivanovii]EFR96352.1 3-isopropylmalate dehydrogenase [Listeria ivanovii FSL F6-596]AIS63213.1 3-isopropylmalate dehydrogenase [Listeria ivanovii subsp. londoniensis]MBK1966786.1 3-isopropylmalate dehydrogenase [Listeria ivanovii subsp. londoniensis]MBK1984027.1 3-isopropylmalate dehydrogenase [Listeria ivanovii subsp. londoniensis]MBK1996256.1 3-isopropylmalate dehydrogenase [Listeria ivanovii subsp. londoniensis]
MTYKITSLAGDGIGPEIMTAGIKVLQAIAKKYQHTFEIEAHPFGGAGIDATGNPIPDSTLKACQNADAILLGAIGGPKWDNAAKRPEDGLLALRKALGLFANIRPIQVPSSISHLSPLKKDIVEGTDFIVVRELTGGLYFGEPKHWDEDAAVDSLTYTRAEIERIIEKAFAIAATRNKKVTSVDKANVLASSKLWRQIAEEVASKHPDITLEHLYVDAAAMILIQQPTTFDVIVTENLFGDILSDEASVITGSLGMLPSASHAESGPSLYEPIHGSAPDIAGQNIANPMSMISSVSMMLRQSFGLFMEADVIDKATAATMEAGFLTADLGGTTSTTDFTKEVLKQIEGGE